MLLIQEYLQNHSFAQLAAEHGVYASFSKSGYKFSLNYDQIEAKESDPLAQECRGLILAFAGGICPITSPQTAKRIDYDSIVAGNTEIIAFPMKRFFNYGQGTAANIDWNGNLSILEKLDGTLTIVYFDPYSNSWNVATRSVSEADQSLTGQTQTFRNLFEEGLINTTGLSFEDWTKGLNKENTFCFELTSVYNRVVVYYPETNVTLLAARNIKTLQEINPESLNIKVPAVKSYPYINLNSLIEWVSSRNPIEHEGVVVKDSKFNRIKLKDPSYIALHHTVSFVGYSDRNVMKLVLAGKEDDVISILPKELVEKIQSYKDGIIRIFKEYDSLFFELKAKATDKKSFALLLKDIHGIWSAPLFNFYDKKAENMRDYIEKNKVNESYSDSLVDKLISLI